MAGAIFVIGRNFPQHWQAALEVGFWESRRQLDIQPGDLLVFWQSGEGLLGVCLATSPAAPVDYQVQSRPWSSHDPVEYRSRYRFTLLADRLQTGMRWNELAALVGRVGVGANTAPLVFDDAGALSLMRALGVPVQSGSGDRTVVSPGENMLREVLDRARPGLTATTAYVPANEAVSTAGGVVFLRDPQAVDRGLRAHAATQNAAARWLSDHGIEPESPVGAVNFDLAWSVNGTKCVGEVKSLHDQNERTQLRLGIGQVLEFAFRLRAKPVLIVECQPSAAYWQELCDEYGIVLVWPDTFVRLVPSA